ncbi:MAG: CotH kinase family protein, partial [Defluviitaleaceae bacterium]|nr:CotH kinase family protein [Defluviitaleaceae bacterium]
MYKKLVSVLLAFAMLFSCVVIVSADVPEITIPRFSHSPGFYSEEFFLAITADAGMVIRYTLDGSIPTEESSVFTEPVRIHSPAPTRANSPMSVQAIGRAYEGGWHNDYVPRLYYNGIVVRARAFDNNGNASETATASFFVERDGRGTFNTRVLSITMEPEHLIHPTQGMYRNWYRADWHNQPDVHSYDGPRHIANVEMFCENGEIMFSQNANVWVFGNWSRRHPKRSIRINFNQGDGDIRDMPELFPQTRRHFYAPNEYVDRFRHLNARVTDRNRTGMRDSVVARLAEPLRPTVQNTMYGAVFINGEFWGMYCLRAHRHEHLLSQMFDIPAANIDLRDSITPLIELVNARDMSSPTAFEELNRYICMDDLIDYLIIGYHFDNWDWITNNFEFWRSTEVMPGVHGADGRWRFIVQDFDEAINHQSNDMMSFFTNVRGVDAPVQTQPWNFGSAQMRSQRGVDFFAGLFENEEFRNTFAARYSTYTGTVFHPSRANAMLDEMLEERVDTIGADLYRWRYHYATSPTNGVNSWINGWGGIATIRSILAHRADYSIEHIRSYYNRTVSGLNLASDLTNISFRTDSDMGFFDIAGAQIRADLFSRGNLHAYDFSLGNFNADYIRGLPVSITARAFDGHEFSHFTVAGGVSGRFTESSITITPSGSEPVTVTAVFEPVAGAAQEAETAEATPEDSPAVSESTRILVQIGSYTLKNLTT